MEARQAIQLMQSSMGGAAARAMAACARPNAAAGIVAAHEVTQRATSLGVLAGELPAGAGPPHRQ